MSKRHRVVRSVVENPKSPEFQQAALRLKRARLRLDYAQSYAKEVLKDIEVPDGHYTYQRALRAESEAIKDYSDCLREYSRRCLDLERRRSKEQGALVRPPLTRLL